MVCLAEARSWVYVDENILVYTLFSKKAVMLGFLKPIRACGSFSASWNHDAFSSNFLRVQVCVLLFVHASRFKLMVIC